MAETAIVILNQDIRLEKSIDRGAPSELEFVCMLTVSK
jgi:hypothetical protein